MLETIRIFIDASLAPAVLVTGIGLLLAGLQTKYSTLAAVIRQLNAEKRNADSDYSLEILTGQIESLFVRARFIRNAIVCFYLTVFFTISSSIVLGLIAIGITLPPSVIIVLFGMALACLFCGLWHATREALLSYRIVQLETARSRNG